MPYSIDPLTADCYEGTSCLINKLNIHDASRLAEVEASITFAKNSELEQHPFSGNFDFEHYKAIHRFLFEDIYEWAGQIRTVDMSKKGTSFTNASEIEKNAAFCFDRLRSMNYFKDLSFDEFIDEIADFYCTTNLLHPFREGNGRTQRAFLTQLIRNAGYDIDFSEMEPDELMIATIFSAQGVTDQLRELFYTHISPSNEQNIIPSLI